MTAVLVLGARGMLGTAVSGWLERRGHRVVGLGRADFDVARDPLEQLEGHVAGSDLVINCAGVVASRIAATPIEDVLRVNAIFPLNLARLCERKRRPLVHVSTDAAFSGRRGGYTELDPLDPVDAYGLSKAAGEPSDAMVLRTSIVGEERGQARSLLEWVRSQAGKEVDGFVNHRWNGLTTVHLAEVIEAIFQRAMYRKGVFHVFSPRPVTKAELLEAMSDTYDLRLAVRRVDAKEACDRTLASVHPLAEALCTKRIEEQLREMRAFFSA